MMGGFGMGSGMGMGFGPDMQINSNPNSYCSECLNLVMPPDQKLFTYDVVLKLGSYITGKVLDEDQQPIPYIKVNARVENSYASAETDENGLFRLEGLRPQLKHTVEVTLRDQNESITKVENLSLPTENLVITVKNNQ